MLGFAACTVNIFPLGDDNERWTTKRRNDGDERRTTMTMDTKVRRLFLMILLGASVFVRAWACHMRAKTLWPQPRRGMLPTTGLFRCSCCSVPCLAMGNGRTRWTGGHVNWFRGFGILRHPARDVRGRIVHATEGRGTRLGGWPQLLDRTLPG